MTEKRTKARFDDEHIASIRVKRTDGSGHMSKHTLFCFTRDISSGGLSFSAHSAPPVGAKLDLSVSFLAPACNADNLTGRVAWVQRIPNGRQCVIGVDLSESDPKSLADWERILAKRTPSK